MGTPEAADGPRLSPGEIAYHDFARAAEGLDEDAVRAFLGEVADAVSAGRDRELRLEERIAELEAELDATRSSSSSTPPADAPDPRTEVLFARLREDDATVAPDPPKSSQGSKGSKRSKRPSPPAESVAGAADAPPVSEPEPELEPEAEPEQEPAAPVPTPDDLLRGRRDELLEPLVTELVRTSKRLLQDEQNVLLDAARRAKARIDADRLLPAQAEHRATWAALLAPAVDAAYSGGRAEVGRARKASTAPERVVNDLATGLIAPLRERLAGTLATVVAQGPYESSAELHRELSSAVGARYREWRGADLELRLGDALAAAYARGTYDGAPSGSLLRWVHDESQRCPDCEDNSLERTVKGQSFPTGQPYPPAHPGCRCLVVVAELHRGE